jgi:hypothetical protein
VFWVDLGEVVGLGRSRSRLIWLKLDKDVTLLVNVRCAQEKLSVLLYAPSCVAPIEPSRVGCVPRGGRGKAGSEVVGFIYFSKESEDVISIHTSRTRLAS